MGTYALSARLASTGVEGLDAVLGGGFPRGSLIILAGNPGTGKTVFSAQFLYRGAVNCGENGVYVSFAESREAFLENMRGFGFDFEKLEREGKFRFLDMLTVKEHAVPSILNMILKEAGEAGAKRLVLDSFSALAQSFKEPIDIRIVVHTILSRIIRRMGCTTIVIEEMPFGSLKIGFGIEEFVADGVIHLKTSELAGHRLRELEILKLRGVRLEEPELIFTLDEGFKVFPPLKLGYQIMPAEKPRRFQPVPDPPDRYSTGSKSFDKALNGGLPRGSVMLLELDEKISTPMSGLLIAPIKANFILQGRGVLHIPASGVDPQIIMREQACYGGTKEKWTRCMKIFIAAPKPMKHAEPLEEYPNVIYLTGNVDEDIDTAFSVREKLKAQTGHSVLSIIGVDTLVTLYGEKATEEILNLNATMARRAGSAIILIAKAGMGGLAVKLSPIADVYLRLTRKHGSLLLYGVKPRTSLYAVESDTSEGCPLPKLTPIL